ncbi:MAG: hypothetical protein FWE23_08895 [Chitinivibrionia bacterium]|nr:hypothetical protein [Chitinivibrionia bacterium]
MGVNIFKDCIITEAGRYVCFDKESQKLYIIEKNEVSVSELSKKELHQLLKHVSK